VQSWPNIAIPASNGSRIIKGISTAGLKAGNYEFRVNATSSIGKDITSTPLTLSDIIVEVEELFYIVGDPVNVTIRTYPTVSQANLSMALFNFTIFDQTFFKDEEVTLTNGRAEKLYDSTSWPVDRRGKTIIYSANVNASVSGRTVEDQASFFLDVFSVDVDTDKNSYLPGQMVEVTTTTEPSQAGGTLTLRVSNSSSDIVKTIGPSAIGADGTSTSTIDTTGWPVDEYDIEASVIKGNYMRNDTGSFDIYLRTFNIFATLDAFSYSDFAMPALTISTTPGQTNSNLTLTVDGPGGEYYEFTKTEFDSTTYLYGVPLLKQPNGTDTITVQITSSTGTNDTSATPATLFYRHSPDLVVVSEPFLLQTLLLLGSSPIFYYAAKKRRQRQ
jgi:hypothetical protein